MELKDIDLLRSNGPNYFLSPLYFGNALVQTGQVNFYHQSSAKTTTLQAGNATADITYTLPTAGPAANNYLLQSSTTGTLAWTTSPSLTSATFAGDITITGPGKGLIVTSPDGTHTTRIRIDDNGLLYTDELT